MMLSYYIRIQWNKTALHYGAWNGHTDTVDILVKHGANVNMKDEVNSGALLMYYGLCMY